MTHEVLPNGSVIGILGGGQLGRMLAMAAARLGYKVRIFEPSAQAPAGDVAISVTQAGYDDHDGADIGSFGHRKTSVLAAGLQAAKHQGATAHAKARFESGAN